MAEAKLTAQAIGKNMETVKIPQETLEQMKKDNKKLLEIVSNIDDGKIVSNSDREFAEKMLTQKQGILQFMDNYAPNKTEEREKALEEQKERLDEMQDVVNGTGHLSDKTREYIDKSLGNESPDLQDSGFAGINHNTDPGFNPAETTPGNNGHVGHGILAGIKNITKSYEEKKQDKLFPDSEKPDISTMSKEEKQGRVEEIYKKVMEDKDYEKNPDKMLDVANKEIREEGLGDTAKEMNREQFEKEMDSRFPEQSKEEKAKSQGMTQKEKFDRVEEIRENEPDQDKADAQIRDEGLSKYARYKDTKEHEAQMDQEYGDSWDDVMKKANEKEAPAEKNPIEKMQDSKKQKEMYPEEEKPNVSEMTNEQKQERVKEIYEKAAQDPSYGKGEKETNRLLDIANKEIREEGLGETARELRQEQVTEDLDSRFGEPTKEQSAVSADLSEQEKEARVNEIRENEPDQVLADAQIRDEGLQKTARKMDVETAKDQMDEKYGQTWEDAMQQSTTKKKDQEKEGDTNKEQKKKTDKVKQQTQKRSISDNKVSPATAVLASVKKEHGAGKQSSIENALGSVTSKAARTIGQKVKEATIDQGKPVGMEH